MAATLAAASDTAATLSTSIRLRSRTAWNTIAPLDAERRASSPGAWYSGKKGTGGRNFADLDGKHLDISLQDVYGN